MKYIIILKSNAENLDIKFSLLNIGAIEIDDKSYLHYFTNSYVEYWSIPKLHKLNYVFFIYRNSKKETLYSEETIRKLLQRKIKIIYLK